MVFWLLSVIPSAEAGTLACGAVLTRDTALEADLVCPEGFAGAALTVAAPGVTLLGGGHSVRVSGGAAVVVQGAGVTLKELVVSGSGQGVVARDTRELTIEGATFDGFDGTAVTLERCQDCSVQDSAFVGARRALAASARGERLNVARNDFSEIHGGWAVSIEGADAWVEGNRFDNARRGLRLVAVPSLWLDDNAFSGGRRAISVERSEGLTLEGLSLEGFPGTALTLRDCQGCAVTASSFVGAGQAVAVVDSHDFFMDGSNALTAISGVVLELLGGSAHLDGLVLTSGEIVAEHSELRVTNHRSCGASLWLHEVQGALDGALASVAQVGGTLQRREGGFPDQDGDELPDACDPCQDPDRDGRCQQDDPCVGILEVDADGDGFCMDTDCDDTLASVHPQGTEVHCNDRDDDCDPSSEDKPDSDKDGVAVCTDCDDLDPARFPGAPERCDGRDDDCDNQPDDGLPFDAWFADADRDGYGSAHAVAYTCDGPPAGHVSNHADCDDERASVHPGAEEILHNGIDDDCNRMSSDTEKGTVWLD